MRFKGWQNVAIIRDNGENANAIAPVIISASRSTDIPGFFGDWFINRLKRGYCAWRNPYNGDNRYVSFEKTRCIVFWTKNPGPILKHLDTIMNKGIGVLFQVSINDYEQEHLELNVPPLNQRIEAVRKLSQIVGKESILWRYDPLILTDKIDCKTLINKISHVGETMHQYTDRLTISFLSHYGKVIKNLAGAGVNARDFSLAQKQQIAYAISALNREWGLQLFSCADSDDLSEFGILPGRCIDPYVIVRNFGHDPAIREFFGLSGLPDLFGDEKVTISFVKDSGQREFCGCTVSKDIGMYNTCRHGCLYCYANASPVKAMRSNIFDNESEFLMCR